VRGFGRFPKVLEEESRKKRRSLLHNLDTRTFYGSDLIRTL
jgi:hypothetical protein